MQVARSITVQPKQSSEGIKWILCEGTNCGGPGTNPPSDYPQIIVPAKTGQHDFTFTIKNPSFGITFAPDPSSPTSAKAALWVTVGQGQHPGQGNNSAGQITNEALSGPASTTLTFTDNNHNPNMMWLSYRLNFVGSQGQTVKPIDPDIKNGGTGLGGGGTSASTALIIGIAVIAVLALAWLGLRYFRRQSISR